VDWGKLIEKLIDRVANFFIVSLAGFTTLLFFDFFASTLLSSLSSKIGVFDFTHSLFKVVGIDLSRQKTEVYPVLILFFYAVVWSYGKMVFILSSVLHDRLKGNYVSEKKGLSSHHRTFLELRNKVIETLERSSLTVIEKEKLTDYFLYYLLRELLGEEERKQLRKVTARALEFGFIGLSSLLSIVIVGLFYAHELLKEKEVCLSIGTSVTTAFLAFGVLLIVNYVVKERYISRNFRLYLLFLLGKTRKDEKSNE